MTTTHTDLAMADAETARDKRRSLDDEDTVPKSVRRSSEATRVDHGVRAAADLYRNGAVTSMSARTDRSHYVETSPPFLSPCSP